MEKSTARRIQIGALVVICVAGLILKTKSYRQSAVMAQDTTAPAPTGITFERKNPSDPNDPRSIPASMGLNVVKKNGRSYIEWDISEAVPMVGAQDWKRPHPYVVKAVISPADARSYAAMLVGVAAQADGLPPTVTGIVPPSPPPPPPPPPAPR